MGWSGSGLCHSLDLISGSAVHSTCGKGEYKEGITDAAFKKPSSGCIQFPPSVHYEIYVFLASFGVGVKFKLTYSYLSQIMLMIELLCVI